MKINIDLTDEEIALLKCNFGEVDCNNCLLKEICSMKSFNDLSMELLRKIDVAN